MKTEFVLIWLAALEKSNEPLTALDPLTWEEVKLIPVKTAKKKNGTVVFYYVSRKELINTLREKHKLRKKCTLSC